MMPVSSPGEAAAFRQGVDAGLCSVITVPVFSQFVPDAAYIAVTSSNASSGLPPVFTFSKTTQTASLEVDDRGRSPAPGSLNFPVPGV